MSEQSQGFTHLSYWIPAILLAMMISGFSTHYFSDDRTSRIIVPVLHWLFPSATPRMLHFMHMGIRKVACLGVQSVQCRAIPRPARRTQWLAFQMGRGYSGHRCH